MASGATSRVALVTTAWTLLADGDAGVTDVIVQNNSTSRVLLALGAAAPASTVKTGIVIANASQPFGRELAAGVKLYGRAKESALSVDVMTYNA
jgi:myo-inositol catabolism protein IolC